MAEIIHTDPVTCTFRSTEWHGLSRDLVFCATDLEAFWDGIERSCDRRRDAWVLAHSKRVRHLVERLDAAVELLMVAEARPVPR